MFEGVTYRFKLWKLERLDAKIWRPYNEIKKVGGSDHFIRLRKAYGELSTDLTLNDHDIDELQSRYFLAQARKYRVPVPPHTDDAKWKESSVTGAKHLSLEGLRELRQAIRIERKERTELARSYISLTIGLGGVIVGILALVFRH